jgi:hypothetical protein
MPRLAPVGLCFLAIAACALVSAAPVSPSSDSASDTYHRVVMVMRHCVRSTDEDFQNEPFPDYQNYTSHQIPTWPGVPMDCLPRGMDIIEGQGYNSRYTFPMPLTVVSDNITRDIQTSQSFLKGLGMTEEEAHFYIDGALFDPSDYGVCPQQPTDAVDAALAARQAALPIPVNHTQLIEYMQAKLGQGVPPALYTILDSVANGTYNGGSQMSGEFGEFFEMQYGGGYEVGWGNITADDMYEFINLLVYKRAIEARALPIVQYTESNLLAHVINALDGTDNGTTIFVGHDTDMDAMATFFNLQWVAPPYTTNHTAPGSAVRFDLIGSSSMATPMVSVSFVYTTYETTEGKLQSVPADFVFGDGNTMDFNSFRSIAEAQLYMPCVRFDH